MQRISRRLAWRNLSIPLKTGVLFLFMMLLLGALTVVALLGQNAVREQLETAFATSVELRSLAQDIQFEIESLDSIEARLVEQRYGWDSFELTRARFASDHAAVIEQIHAGADRTEELAAAALTGGDSALVTVELRAIRSGTGETAESFEQMLTIIARLAHPRDGIFAELDAVGDDLEDLTASTGSAELLGELAAMRNLERTLTSTGSAEDLADLQNAAQAYLDTLDGTPGLAGYAGDAAPLVSRYLEHASEVSRLLTSLNDTFFTAQNRKASLRAAASRLATMMEAQREAQLERINAIQNRVRMIMFAGLGVALILGGFLAYLFGRSLSLSARSLLRLIRQFELGDLAARAPGGGEDEFSQLGAGFNAMAAQLEELVGGLEQRVAERTRDLSMTAEIGYAVTARRDPRDLMNETVQLICDRFGYYHAQVFLLDDAGQMANLVASTGTAGRELLARRHALAVGSQSVIGQVTARAVPIIAADTDRSGIHRRNELLPDTRAEMALPMRIGDRVIGALDVQSVAPDVFDEDVVAVFQIMADQLAVALENARLQNQLADAQDTIAALERGVTRETWSAFQQGREAGAPLGFELSGDRIRPRQQPLPTPLSLAIEQGQLVRSENGDSEYQLAVPIRVRGQVIGAFGFGGESLRGLSADDLSLVEAVAERVGMALENMRLVEETGRRAEQEQVLNEITAKLVGSTDVNQILQTTVRELGRVLRAPQTTVQLRREGAGHE